MGIWTLRAKPMESKFTYTPTMMCITDLNYVLTMQDHWDCAIHCVAEKDHQATEVFTIKQGSEWTATKKINCC